MICLKRRAIKRADSALYFTLLLHTIALHHQSVVAPNVRHQSIYIKKLVIVVKIPRSHQFSNQIVTSK